MNGPSAIEVEATRAFADNSLSRIVHLVEEAQAQKSRAQRFVDRFSDRYSPAVLVAALAGRRRPAAPRRGLERVGPAGGDAPRRRRAVRPGDVGAGGRRRGDQPGRPAGDPDQGRRPARDPRRGPDHLPRQDRHAHPRHAAGDRLRDSARASEPAEAMLVAAAVEARSEHPLARAILDHVRAEGIDPPPAEGFEAVVGHGARATLDGREVWVGSPRLLAQLAPEAAPPRRGGAARAGGQDGRAGRARGRGAGGGGDARRAAPGGARGARRAAARSGSGTW